MTLSQTEVKQVVGKRKNKKLISDTYIQSLNLTAKMTLLFNKNYQLKVWGQ